MDPSGVRTRTWLPLRPSAGRVVPALISVSREAAPLSARSQVVRDTTVATDAVLADGVAVSCRIGTHPG